MAEMKITRLGTPTDTVKPLGIPPGYVRARNEAELLERASHSELVLFWPGTLAAGTRSLGFIPFDCKLITVYIKAGTAGTGATKATGVVKVDGSGIHTASDLDVTTLIKPTLTTTTASADKLVEFTYTDATTTQAENVTVGLVYRLVKNELSNPVA